MSRPFNTPNEELPACVQKLAEQVPACFDRVIWVSWLQSSWSSVLNDTVARKQMERGRVPDYCAECTCGHQDRMREQGRCFPTHPKYEIKGGVNV